MRRLLSANHDLSHSLNSSHVDHPCLEIATPQGKGSSHQAHRQEDRSVQTDKGDSSGCTLAQQVADGGEKQGLESKTVATPREVGSQQTVDQSRIECARREKPHGRQAPNWRD